MPDLRDLSWLPGEELHDWVVAQRWFASKSREVTAINVVEAVPLRTEGSPQLVLALMEAVFSAGAHQTHPGAPRPRPRAAGRGEGGSFPPGGQTAPDRVPGP